MSSVADRLGEAINDSDSSISGLSKQLKEAGVRGHSRNRVHSYLNGDTTPGLKWIRAAASILGVRESWLAFGEGPKTEGAPRWIGHPLRRQLTEELDWFADSRMGVRWTFLDLLHHYDHRMERKRWHPGEGPGPLGKPVIERAKDLTAVLMLPVVVWGYYPKDLPDEYWMGVMSALLTTDRRFFTRDDVTRGPPPLNELEESPLYKRLRENL